MGAITLYVVLAFAFSSVFYALIIASGHVGWGNGWYATGLDWCPAAAALLTCRLLRIDIGTIGWRWRLWRWHILAYATPLLFCLIGYVAVWAAGLGGFPNGKTVDSLKAALGIPSLSTSQVILLWTFLSMTAGTMRSLASAIGEQIGWSGSLSPRLAERYGFTPAAFITGAVWAIWHLPVLFFADYYDSASHVWFSLPCFVIELLGLGVIILWLRLLPAACGRARWCMPASIPGTTNASDSSMATDADCGSSPSRSCLPSTFDGMAPSRSPASVQESRDGVPSSQTPEGLQAPRPMHRYPQRLP